MKRRKSLSIALAVLFAAGAMTACHRDPNTRKRSYYSKAMRYYAKGGFEAAAIELRNALRIDPRYADAHYLMARCDLRLGLIGDAYKQLLDTVELDPRNWSAQVDLGYLFFGARQYDQAEAKAKLVLSADPANAQAHALLGNTQAALGHQDQSIAEMKKSIELAPTAETYMNLAALEGQAKDVVEAEKDYKQAISLAPRAMGPCLELGRFYTRQHRFADAEREFRQAINLEPKSVAPRTALIGLYLMEGQESQAEQAAKDAKLAFKDNPQAYGILGEFYATTRQSGKAVAEYATLYSEHPKNLSVATAYTQLLISQNNLKDATKINGEVLKRAPGNAQAIIQKGQMLAREGHPDDAVLTLESALKTEPENPDLHYVLGAAYNQAGKAELAESEWRRAIQLRPQALDAQEALAAAELTRREFKTLASSAEAIVGLFPASPLGYSYRGIVSESRGDLKAAESDFDKAIAVGLKDPLGYYRLGELETAEKRYKEAERNFETALALDPSSAPGLQGLVALYRAQKQPERAIERIQQQITKAPPNAVFYFLLAENLRDQGQSAAAEVAAQKSLALDKNNPLATIMLGQVETLRGETDQAEATYRQSIQTQPRDTANYVLFAVLLSRKGDFQQAEQLYRKALAIQPDFAPAANNLAYLLLGHGGNLDEALSLAQTARRGMPNSPNVADTLGLAYYKKGDYGLASEFLKEGLQKDPNNPALNYHMGMVDQKTQNSAQAIEHFRRVLKVAPNYDGADEIRRLLAAMGKG